MKKQQIGVVAFAFGVPSTLLSNCEIARVASEIASSGNYPIFTQEFVPVNSGLDVEYVIEPLGNETYASTLEIAKQTINWVRDRDLTDIYVVAADVHLWRCLRDLRWVAFEEWVSIRVESRAVPVGWQKDSRQRRVTSPWRWYPREFVLRALPVAIYSRVAV